MRERTMRRKGRGGCLSVEGAGLLFFNAPLEPWFERSLCNPQEGTLCNRFYRCMSTAAPLAAPLAQTFFASLGTHTVISGIL